MRKVVVIQIPDEKVKNDVTLFVKTANGFSSRLTVSREGNTVNAKSLLGLLSMGLHRGAEVALTGEGEDAQDALESLAAVLEDRA